MQIQIIVVGKLKEKYLKDGTDEYLKRLQSYAKMEIIEVAEEKEMHNSSLADELIIKSKEGGRIEKHIKSDTILIALAIEGDMLSSEALANQMAEMALAGKSHLTFVIGGSLGLDANIIKRADIVLSFSKMTFPHQLMRLILLEQLYRGFRINTGAPYHK